MRFLPLTVLFAALLASFNGPAFAADGVTPQPAAALYGAPKYDPGFKHFDYANPEAPKGGTLRLGAEGTFDNLNPFIVKGVAPAGLIGYVYEPLMEQSTDEPFTVYGLLAESIELAPDNSWVAFNLRPEAEWSDGKPVTADDVVWSFHTLVDKGVPTYKIMFGDVASVEATGQRRIKFTFRTKDNKELPLILAQMPVLPKHFWEEQGRNIGDTTVEPPVGSGPYKVGDVQLGREIKFVRDPKWWGAKLALNKGRWNFDTIQTDYYKDAAVALEAFIGGQYDVREERVAKMWATAYDAAPVRDGRITKQDIANQAPEPMQAFVYNTRRPVFADRAVRNALAYAFDFEWSNKQFAYGSYVRTRSYFPNTDLESHDLPQGKELAILNTLKGRIPDEVFTAEYNPPHTDGSGDNRANLRQAVKILEDAGYQIQDDGVRKNTKTGQRLDFTILSDDDALTRWTLPFVQNLQRIGVHAQIKMVDPSQYQNLVNNFDYDMIVGDFAESNSPGNEQREYWGAAKANALGSRNLAGVQDPAVDDLVSLIIHAQTRDDLTASVHALDRVLQFGYYVIPHWYIDKWRLAWWNTIERPGNLSPLSPNIEDTWWSKKTAAPPPIKK